MQVLIAGCGWLGMAVAERLIARGDRVIGVRSDVDRAETLRAYGIEPLTLDLADPASADRLPAGIEAILALQAAKGGDAVAYRRAYLGVNETLLAYAHRNSVKSFIYSGSTGLFGQCDGSEVHEGTAPQPVGPTGEILAEAEQRLLAAAGSGLPVRVVRLSGLYGPGRLWMLDRIRQGLMPLGAGDASWMNACHRDDAANTLIAALDHGRDGAIYHATDEQPMRRGELIRFVSGRLGLTPPWDGNPAPRGPNRRIRGEATRQELGLRCRWPSMREGLEPFLD